MSSSENNNNVGFYFFKGRQRRLSMCTTICDQHTETVNRTFFFLFYLSKPLQGWRGAVSQRESSEHRVEEEQSAAHSHHTEVGHINKKKTNNFFFEEVYISEEGGSRQIWKKFKFILRLSLISGDLF